MTQRTAFEQASGMIRHPRWASTAISAVILTVVALLLFGRAMDRDLNHDEHQFLVPGALLARDGYLPYRDYPLFHLPNLVFVYAILDAVTGWPVLSAKAFSEICSFGVMFLLFSRSNHAERQPRSLSTLSSSIAAVALLLFDPLFLFTSGKTWNHEFPTAMMFCAIVLQAGAAPSQAVTCQALSGLCAGLAVGARLTFLPILVPLLLIGCFYAPASRRRWQIVAAWTAGVLLGLLPTAYLFAQGPAAFVFDNFRFPRLRLLDPENTRIQKTAAVWRKLRFFFKEVAVPSWPLFLAYVAYALRPAWTWRKTRQAAAYPCALVAATVPFVLAGCFAPSRYQYQHFFALNCLLALGIAYGCLVLWEGRASRWQRYPLLVLAAISTFGAIPNRSESEKKYRPAGLLAYTSAQNLFQPEEWFPVRLHERGEEMKALVPRGPLLTLAPALASEAGISVYPSLATGAFAWRSAALIPADMRQRLKFIAPADLPSAMAEQPPAAILTGVEDDELEQPLVEYARWVGFHPKPLLRKQILWLPR